MKNLLFIFVPVMFFTACNDAAGPIPSTAVPPQSETAKAPESKESSQSVPATKPVSSTSKLDYQSNADGARWGWKEEKSHPLGCVSQCGSKYDIDLLNTKDDRYRLTITVLLDGRKVYAWRGYTWSVFRILRDRLFYAKFHISSSGGSIVAVDLNTGKKLWISRLEALGPIQHSAYMNRMNLDANDRVVTIYGNESMGKYIEIKDAVTGDTVGHRIFETDDK